MESHTEVTIRFDSKFRIFAQHYRKLTTRGQKMQSQRRIRKWSLKTRTP